MDDNMERQDFFHQVDKVRLPGGMFPLPPVEMGDPGKERPSYAGPAIFKDLNDILELNLDPDVGPTLDPTVVANAKIERGIIILAAKKDGIFGKKNDPATLKGKVAQIMEDAIGSFDD